MKEYTITTWNDGLMTSERLFTFDSLEEALQEAYRASHHTTLTELIYHNEETDYDICTQFVDGHMIKENAWSENQ